ncbi:MAG: ABC transporter permease [Anaerolineaceae bacterium]|nr:ABC transporter permease [Anaerolineaceae bacterium]
MTEENKYSSENNMDLPKQTNPNPDGLKLEGLQAPYPAEGQASEENKQRPQGEPPHSEMALDDARRIKVLSPGMMVFKRFIRNKLAVVGLVILFFMFTFSFIGPLLSPYGQAQVFTGAGNMSKEYAGATYNEELRYTVAEGKSFGGAERAQFLLAVGKNLPTFTSGNKAFSYVKEGDGYYRIKELTPLVEILARIFKPLGDAPLPNGLREAYEKALADDQSIFELEGVQYTIVKDGKATRIATDEEVAIGTLYIFDAYEEANRSFVQSFKFIAPAGHAFALQEKSFEADGKRYQIEYGDGQATIKDASGKAFADISNIIVNPLDQAAFLPVAFKSLVRESIADRKNDFYFTDDKGQEMHYTIVRVNRTFNIKTDTTISLIRQYEEPSARHPLGLDNNGMDVMTRLMYGGQVSLMVGFIVIIIEMVIGVIIGGISGYFGGALDNALMRFVDLFNALPFYPMVMILGSVMDTLEIDPRGRIFILMAVLGILGWTGTARVVRGQILSLREQDFMVATEATGISTRKRIFKHLVPNVMPLLIVSATAGLGGIIITEATLGFLGLGVKYPLASWGSIINVSSDAYVMTNFWFMWIPAGLLILLTVLGFNFVGDGLRDAYDPKMKR